MHVSGSDSLFRLPTAAAARAARPVEAAKPATAAAAPPAAAAPSPAPAQAPRGATLWDLLTEDERAFFAREAALGPITYRPGRRGATAAPPTGQRIDVKG